MLPFVYDYMFFFPHLILGMNQNSIGKRVSDFWLFWKFEKYGVNEVKACRKGGRGFLIKTDFCLESWTPSLFSHTTTLAKSLEYFHR